MNDYEQRQQIEAARAEGDRRARHARWQAGETISELEGDLEQANEELDRLRRKVKLGDALAKACITTNEDTDGDDDGVVSAVCLVCGDGWVVGETPSHTDPLEEYGCALRAYEDCDA